MDALFSQPWPTPALTEQQQQHLVSLAHSSSSDTICSYDASTGVSSSLSPSTDGSTASPASISRQDEGEDSFHDPVLQYINRLLMEEVMEDHHCMLRECISYHATVKGFSDILNDSYTHSNDNDVSRSSFREDLRSDLFPDAEEYRNFEQEMSVWMPGAREQSFSSILGQQQAQLDQRGVLWMEDLLKFMPSDSQKQQDSAAVAPVSSRTIDVCKTEETKAYVEPLESSLSILTQRNNNGTQRNSPGVLIPQVVLNDSILQPGNSLLQQGNVSFSCNDMQNQQNNAGYIMQPPMAARYDMRNGAQTTVSGNLDNIQGGSEEFAQLFRNIASLNSSSARLKRSVHETGLVAAIKQGPKGSGSLLVSDDVSDNSSNNIEVDRISYVKNSDLNAECHAKFLNEGLSALREKLIREPVLASTNTSKPGKGARKLATTADLMNLLLSCAQAVGAGNSKRAQEILREIRQDASPFGNDLQRLAHYFAEGLVARISGTGAALYTAFTNNAPSAAKTLKAHSLFVGVCPIVKVSHFFANRAIVEAAKDATRLHIVDFGILYGIQWPSLISALADRKGGPPVLRITGIDFPSPGNNPAERVEWTGRLLSEYASAYGVPFEYHAIADKWDNIKPSSLRLRQDEVLVVHSMFRLRHLLDESVTPSNPRNTVLNNILNMNPNLFVQGISNGNYTSPFFMSRFKEALTSFSCMYDMLEATIPSDNQERIMIEREVLGRDILNVVACEGAERVERPETYRQWQNRVQKVGFVQKRLDEVMLRDVQDIIKRKFNKNFNVDRDGCWMLLGWKGKVVKALTLWTSGR